MDHLAEVASKITRLSDSNRRLNYSLDPINSVGCLPHLLGQCHFSEFEVFNCAALMYERTHGFSYHQDLELVGRSILAKFP